jgi:hypothetical protein
MKNTTYLLTLLIVIAIGCNKPEKESKSVSTAQITDVTTAQLISEPLPAVKSSPVIFTIDPTKKQELTTEKGSKIIIPKNAFVDKHGKPIKGKVDIVFEEYHDATDIILSGIPMNITTDEGEEASFESAGMFRIEGKQKGKEIMLANNKTMEVKLASFKTGDDFNFYEYSESEGNWTEKAQSVKEVANEDRVKALENISDEPTRPIEIRKAKNSDLVFDFAINEAINPEFAQLEDVMWKLSEDAEEKVAFNETIRSPRLECIDQAMSVFRLTGSTKSGKKINTRVQPVLFGSSWKKAQASFKAKLAKYNTAVETRKAEDARLDKMTKNTRNFIVSGFGVYNCDRLYKLKRKIQFDALFFVPALNKILRKGFLIQNKKNAIPYTSTSGYKFTFDPRATNTVITFDEYGNVYEFTEDDFKQIKKSTSIRSGVYTFKMRETNFQINSPDDLKDYLASL